MMHQDLIRFPIKKHHSSKIPYESQLNVRAFVPFCPFLQIQEITSVIQQPNKSMSLMAIIIS